MFTSHQICVGGAHLELCISYCEYLCLYKTSIGRPLSNVWVLQINFQHDPTTDLLFEFNFRFCIMFTSHQICVGGAHFKQCISDCEYLCLYETSIGRPLSNVWVLQIMFGHHRRLPFYQILDHFPINFNPLLP